MGTPQHPPSYTPTGLDRSRREAATELAAQPPRALTHGLGQVPEGGGVGEVQRLALVVGQDPGEDLGGRARGQLNTHVDRLAAPVVPGRHPGASTFAVSGHRACGLGAAGPVRGAARNPAPAACGPQPRPGARPAPRVHRPAGPARRTGYWFRSA